LEVPGDFQSLKRASSQAALAWRLHLRQALRHYFARGYTLVDAFNQQESAFLVLERS
jgi:predicted GNAT superfamily acetyltransferase